MAEADAQEPLDKPDAAAAPVSAAAPDEAPAMSFDAAFKPQGDGFDQAFKPQAPNFFSFPTSMDASEWKAYLKSGTTGAIISAFGDAFTGPGLSDEVGEALRKAGVYNDAAKQHQAVTDSFAQGIFRPVVNSFRAFNEKLLIGPAVTAADALARGAEAVLSKLPQNLGAEAEAEPAGPLPSPETWLARQIGMKALGRDVAAAGEMAMTFGHVIPGGPVLPAPIARSRAASVIGEGESGFFGTRQPSEADVSARAAAAGDIPHEEPAPAAGAREAEAPAVAGARDVHAVAREVAPETFRQFDPLVSQRDSLAQWMPEIRAKAEANIEANPPEALQGLDAQIAATERKVENAGARTREGFEDKLADLHDQRADMVADLVRGHPDVTTVRLAQEKVRRQMTDLAPEVSAAYREAATRVPAIEEPAAPPEAPIAAHPVPAGVQEPVAAPPVGETAAPVVAPPVVPPPSGPVSTPEMVKTIAADVEAKLIAAGRPQEEAAAAAQILASHYEARAQRFGGKLGTAQELYNREGPTVRAGQQRETRGNARTREFAQTEPLDFTPGGGSKEAKIGNTSITYGVSKDGKTAEVILIKSPKSLRGQGSARAAMSEFLRQADERGLTTFLTPEPMDKGVSKSKLTDFYKSLGYVENKGRNKDFSSRSAMVREPAAGKTLFQSAYHGSPHIFDQFTLDHIGKGEGAQAYGHGLYFASNKAVAKFYRNKLSGAVQPFFRGDKVDRGTFLGQAILTLEDDAKKIGFEDARDEVLKDLRARRERQGTGAKFGQLDEASLAELHEAIAKIEDAKEGDTKVAAGRLYHVELAPEDADWLDHDKPLSQQSDKVKAALEKLGVNIPTQAEIKAAGVKYHELSNQYDALPPNRRGEVAADLNRAKSDLHDVVTRSHMTGRDAYEEIVRRFEPAKADESGLRGWTHPVQTVNDSTGNRAAASEALKDAGIPGIKYLDGSSRGRGDGNHNFVVFDPKDVAIKEYEQAKKGSITFSPRDAHALIKLFKDADASTFIHEASHNFLEELLRDAEHEAAPAEVRADAATARKWLGAESGPVKTAGHEKWARGFERYMMEGIAPTKALASVFEKFKNWLTQIYQTVAKLRSPINDDIRDVFDRLLTKTPERATIAPELPLERGLADAHEVSAETTPAAGTGGAAHQVHVETAEQARAKAQEIVNELRLRRGEPAGEAGGGAPQRPGDAGGGDAAGNPTGENGGLPGPGAVVPGGGQAAPAGYGPPRPGDNLGPTRASGLYAKVPKRPPSFADWVKERGGIKPEDFAKVIGAERRSKPGLVKETGESINDLLRSAWSPENGGFFPEHAQAPTEREFLAKLGQDLKDGNVWAESQAADVEVYKSALERNAEVDRLAHELHINQKGMSHGEFWDAVADRMSIDDRARLLESQASAHEESLADADRQAQEFLDSRGEAWEADAIERATAPRTLEDLENERRQEEAARGPFQGPADDANLGPAGGGARGVQEGGGPRGPGAEPAGSGSPAGGGAGPESVNRPPRLTDGAADAAAGHLGKAGFNPDAPWKAGADGKDLAGNIRLENLRTSDDVDDLLRAWARGRDDLFDARHNYESYRGQVEVEAARALLCDVAASTLEAERKLAQTGTEADAVALLQWRDRLNMVGDKVSTLAAGAGRTLAAFRKMDDAKAVMARLEGKTLFQLQNQARLNSTLDTPGQLAHAVRQQSLTPYEQGRSMLIEYYVNNLISGPITHGAYMVSNLVTALVKAGIEVPLAAGVRAVREVVTGAPVEGVHLAEAKAMWLSLSKGFRDGGPAAWQALKSGVPGLLEGEETAPQLPYGVSAGAQHAIPGMLGKIANAPSNVVTAIHTLGRTVNYEMEKAALIARQASKEGLEGDAFARRVAELDQKTPLAIMQEAATEATKMVLMDRAKWGSLTSKIANLSNSWLPLKLSLPFVQVGANLLHGGLVERTPIGLFEQQIRDNLMGKNGAAARDIQAGKIATGTAIALGVYSLAAEGLITGSEPKDSKEAALWRMSGKQEYSIRAFDHWVPYRKWLGWFGPLVGMAANVHEVGRTMEDKGLAAAATAAVFGFSEVVADESWFRGMSDFVNAAKHWDTEGERYIRNLATNFIPFSVGMSQVAHLVDPYRRRADGFMQQAQTKIPGLSEDLMASRDIFGEPLASHMIITPTRVNDDPVIKAMQAVNVWPRTVDKKIRGVELTGQQYDDYARIAGRLAKAKLDTIVNRPGFDQIPGHIRRKEMMDAVSHSREAARSTVITMSLHGPNDIAALARANKSAERADFDER